MVCADRVAINGSVPSVLLPPDLSNGYPNYNNASTLIVSFTVNNHLADKDNEMAEIWEDGFLKYIKNYTGKHVDISFSAEVSSL